MSKQHYYLAAIIAAGIILGAIIFRGCDTSPSHKEDNREVKLLQEALRNTEDKAAADSARLVQRIGSLAVANQDLQNKKQVVETELQKLRKERKALSDKLDTARANKDTAGYIAACDSLQERTRVQDEVTGMYVAYVDSVEANHVAQLDAKDSLLASRQELIAQLRSANTITFEKYNALSADYNKVTRRLKRERILSRVLAVATTVAGTFIILKK